MQSSVFANKVALVTGAASGIGRAIALRLADGGAKVVCADIRESAQPNGYEKKADQTTVECIRENGGDAVFFPCDVTDVQQVDELFQKAKDHYGPVDILCNVAGVAMPSVPMHEKPTEHFERVMNVCLRGVWNCSREAVWQMLEKKQGGKIVNISSVAAIRGIEGQSEYCVAKAAVSSLTRQMAVDYGPLGINVNAVAPGWIQTAMQRFQTHEPREAAYIADTPLRRTGTADDVAAAVAFLASSDADYIQGQELVVDGGNTIVWDSYLRLEKGNKART